MAKKPKRPRDPNQLAKMIAGIATGEIDDDSGNVNQKRRKAGLKGSTARNQKLTPEQKSEIAHLAAEARWKKTDD